MPIREFEIRGYRSIGGLCLQLGRVNVITGPNGCGKSNLYRSLSLVAAAARGRLARSLAEEGGMPSVLSAGTRTGLSATKLSLRVALDEFSYELVCGMSAATDRNSLFTLDPMVKNESVWHGERRQGSTVLEREDTTAWTRDANFEREAYPLALVASESVLSQLREPHRYPELSFLRNTLLDWRFYHQFRTDVSSPIRSPQVGVFTPAIANDGTDMVAALQTILEVGDRELLGEVFDSAFPGASFRIQRSSCALDLLTRMPGVGRDLTLAELSDGTLRFLCLMAVLLSPRPPALLALNEPETSLHQDLIEPLAALLVRASQRSQLWITTHSANLAESVCRATGEQPLRLQAIDGETQLPSHSVFGHRLDDG